MGAELTAPVGPEATYVNGARPALPREARLAGCLKSAARSDPELGPRSHCLGPRTAAARFIGITWPVTDRIGDEITLDEVERVTI